MKPITKTSNERKKPESEITIRPVKESDYAALKELCEKRFGEGYLDYDYFRKMLSFPELNQVADDGGKPVALISAVPESPEELAQSMQIDLQELLQDAAGRPTIHCRTGICDEQHEGQGLVTKLLREVIDNARKLGYGIIVSALWMYGGKVPVEKVVLDCGFVPIGIRHGIWYNNKNYHCLVCKGPCRCDAKITKLVL